MRSALFVHSAVRDFILLYVMSQPYDAKAPGDNAMLVSECVGHVDLMYVLSDAYWEADFDLINQHVERCLLLPHAVYMNCITIKGDTDIPTTFSVDNHVVGLHVPGIFRNWLARVRRRRRGTSGRCA